MQYQQIFWQKKLSPKQLIIDWDKFINLFDQYIHQTVYIQLNDTQKQYIKSLIDPQNKNIVYKNSYLIFLRQFWDLPSNRTKFLKGHINLTKVPKIKFISSLKDQESVLLKIFYLINDQKDLNINKNSNNKFQSIIFQWKGSKIYMMNRQSQIILQKNIKTQNFLTLGHQQYNDIVIHDNFYINKQHLRLIKTKIKKKIQKKPSYLFNEDKDKKNLQQTHWYIRDISKSNRLNYEIETPFKYVVVRPGISVFIGMTHQYQIKIIKGTKSQINQNDFKPIIEGLNSDRINYLGQLDPSIPVKSIIDIPNKQINHKDVQYWYNKGIKYQEVLQTGPKKQIFDGPNGQKVQMPLNLQIINKYTKQKIEYNLFRTNVTIGRNSKCNIKIDKPTIRNIQCEFVCMSGIWMIKNIMENCSTNLKDESQIKKSFKIRNLQVGLTSTISRDNLTSSNRIDLPNTCEHNICTNNLRITLSFPKPLQQQE